MQHSGDGVLNRTDHSGTEREAPGDRSRRRHPHLETRCPPESACPPGQALAALDRFVDLALKCLIGGNEPLATETESVTRRDSSTIWL